MSEQEQDAVLGRLVREKAAALKRKTILDAEINLVRDVCDQVLVRGRVLKPEEAAAKLEPIRKYFDVDAYTALLEERERVQNDLVDRIRQLRELGVPD